jgi:DNA-binding NarL/FixJ family response regulator
MSQRSMQRTSRHSTDPTPRERQVLELICLGHSTKQIAGLLGISFKTAACHRTRLMDKAGVHDPISLFRWALLQGYTVLDPRAKVAGLPTADAPVFKAQSRVG